MNQPDFIQDFRLINQILAKLSALNASLVALSREKAVLSACQMEAITGELTEAIRQVIHSPEPKTEEHEYEHEFAIADGVLIVKSSSSLSLPIGKHHLSPNDVENLIEALESACWTEIDLSVSQSLDRLADSMGFDRGGHF